MIKILPILFSFIALISCSSKEVETRIVEHNITQIKHVYLKCDFNISKEPEIKTENMHQILESITGLAVDSVKLRQEIQYVPCIEIHEIGYDINKTTE